MRSDINVVEQANISHFSKLDDIGTHFRLFESFFVDALVDVIDCWLHQVELS